MRVSSRPWRLSHCSGPAAALCAVSLLAQAVPVRAQPSDPAPGTDRIEWDDDFSRFGRGDFAALSLLTATTLTWEQLAGPDGPSPVIHTRRLRGRLDYRIRNALRPRNARGRDAADLASDVLGVAVVSWALGVDPALALWSSRGSRDLAQQLFFIHLLSFTASAAAVLLTKSLVGRPRPYVIDCHAPTEQGSERRCTLRSRYHSFYSGHSAQAFTAASLICLHHSQLPLYRHRAADATACGGAMLIASSVALLRMVADRHHFTDVLFGAVMGFLAGFVMPRFVHYG